MSTKTNDKKMDVLTPHSFMFCWRKETAFLEGDLVIYVRMQPGCSFELLVEKFGERLGGEWRRWGEKGGGEAWEKGWGHRQCGR